MMLLQYYLRSPVRMASFAQKIYLIQIGPDPDDPFTLLYPNDGESVQKPTDFSDFAAACDSEGLRGVRVAVRNPYFAFVGSL